MQQQHHPPSTSAWSSRAALSTPLVRSPPLLLPLRSSHFHRRLRLPLLVLVSPNQIKMAVHRHAPP